MRKSISIVLFGWLVSSYTFASPFSTMDGCAKTESCSPSYQTYPVSYQNSVSNSNEPIAGLVTVSGVQSVEPENSGEYQSMPKYGSLALLVIGLFGLGAARRRV